MFRTVMLAVCAVLAGMSSATAQQQLPPPDDTSLVPFICNGSRYLSSGSSGAGEADVGLGLLSVTGQTYEVFPQDWVNGATSGVRINGIAASRESQFIYAVDHAPADYKVADGYAPTVRRIGWTTFARDELDQETLTLDPLNIQNAITDERLFGGTMVPADVMGVTTPSGSNEVYVVTGAIGIPTSRTVMTIIDVHPPTSSSAFDGTVLVRTELTWDDGSNHTTGIADIGYNPTDGRIYAWDNVANSVVEISPGGIISLVDTADSNLSMPPNDPSVQSYGAYFERESNGQAYIFGGTTNVQDDLFALDFSDHITNPSLPVIIGNVTAANPPGSFSVTDGTSMCGAAPQFTKVVDQQRICQGGTLTYTYTFTNNSDQDFSGLSFDDDIAPDFTVTTIAISDPSATDLSAGNSIQFNNISVDAGGQVVITVTVEAGSATGTFSNQATMSGVPAAFGDTWLSDDPTTAEDRDPTDVIVRACHSEVTITKRFDNANGNLPDLTNANFEFTFTGSNCSADPVSFGGTPGTQTTVANVGDVCQVNETISGVTLPVNCSWQTVYSPSDTITVTQSGPNATTATNSVECQAPVPPEHFQCYLIEPVTKFEPVELRLRDQFGESRNVVVEPKYLCPPAEKTRLGQKPEPVINWDDHLVCYLLKEPLPVNWLVDVDNQFGVQRLRVIKTRLLCVPSTKTVLYDLGIDKRLVNGPLHEGDTAEFQITVTNLGSPIDPGSHAIFVEDILPSELAFVSASGPDWDCQPFGSPVAGVNCEYVGTGTFEPGDTLPLTLQAVVETGEKFQQCALVDPQNLVETDTSNNESCVTVTVAPEETYPRLEIEKEAVTPICVPGGNCVFMVTLKNTGTGTYTGSPQITDLVSAAGMTLQPVVYNSSSSGVTFTTLSCVPSPPATIPPGGIPCAVSSLQLPPGGWITFEYTLTIPKNTRPGKLEQCVRHNELGAAGNVESCVVVEIAGDTGLPQKIDLRLKKRLLNGPLRVGDTAVFEIQIFNDADPVNVAPPLSLVVSDTLPPGFTYSGYSANGPWLCPTPGQPGPVVCGWAGGSPVPTGALGTIRLEAVVTEGRGGLQCAEVAVIGETDIVPGNNRDCVEVGVRPPKREADLGIKKALLNRDPLVPGGTARFNITVYNANGPIAAPGQITVNDTLPAGFSFAGSVGAGWNCNVTGNGGRNFSCTLAFGTTLPPGWSSSLTVDATISGDSRGGRQCATVSILPYADVNAANDRACIGIEVAPPKREADLGIKKALLNRDPLVRGGTARFNITVYNANGPIAGPGQISVNDTLPAGFSFAGSVGAGWNCNVTGNGGRNFSCTLTFGTTLLPGWSSSLIVNTTISGDSRGGRQCATVSLVPHTDVVSDNDRTCVKVEVRRREGGDNGGTGTGGGTPPIGIACVADLPKGDPILNLREEPSGRAKIIRQLPAGTVLNLLDRRGRWSRVQVVIDGRQGPVGWVASRYTKRVADVRQCQRFLPAPDTGSGPVTVPGAPTGTPGTERLACVAGLSRADSLLNLRAKPSAKGRILGQLPNGTALVILERKGKWLMVRTEVKGTEIEGWVSRQFTKEVRDSGQCSMFVK